MLDALLGLLKFAFVSYCVVRVLKFLHVIVLSFIAHFLTPEYSLEHLKDGWTVVTGGTDGIGRAYIEELAKTRGIKKFLLIGRNEKKLKTTALELEERYGATVRTHVFDFESTDFSKLPPNLAEENVSILVNCAGIAPDLVGNLVEMPQGLPTKILQVNLMSSVKLIELILPGMVKRNKGVIVNVSSITGWRPLPYISSYPASKAAISFFSNACADEFRNTNVKIQTLIPLLVATKVASYTEEEANNIFVVSTDNFARQAVRLIGRWEMTTGCIQHDIQSALGTLISFALFKAAFVPLVMLGIHKQRLVDYRNNHKSQ